MNDGPQTRANVLGAAREALLDVGYAGFSTRQVAERAGVPLSQIHYHFGSRHNLVLALLEEENLRLLARQRELYQSDLPLWKQWEQACDFLDADLASGYVQLLQEMTAAGWSNPEIATAVRSVLGGWFELLAETAGKAEGRHGSLGAFSADEVSVLAGAVFLGVEALILLGFDEDVLPTRSALRKVGDMLQVLETG